MRSGWSPRAFANWRTAPRGMTKRLRGLNSNVLRLGTPSAQTVAMPLPVREGVDDLVECELERGSARTGRKLGDARFGDALHAGYLDEGAVALTLVPRGDLHGAEVFDEVAAVYGETLRLHPPVVSEPAVAASARDRVLLGAILGHVILLRRCWRTLAVLMVPDSGGVVGRWARSPRPAAIRTSRLA